MMFVVLGMPLRMRSYHVNRYGIYTLVTHFGGAQQVDRVVVE